MKYKQYLAGLISSIFLCLLIFSDIVVYAVTYTDITYAGQIVDSITYNGITVNAIYAPYYSISNYNEDATYCCAAFVKKFYSSVYGVNPYNLNYKQIPKVSGGSFSETSSPKKGDIVRFNNVSHWAIVKNVSGDTVTIIQQNSWWNSKTSAVVGETISASSSAYTFFRYSGYKDDDSGEEITQTPVDLGNFYASIINVNAQKNLNNDYDNNGNVTLRTANINLSQKWKFEKQSDGSYKISSVWDGKCLEVENAGKTNGSNVRVYEDNGTDAQRWYIYSESGAYYFKSKLSDCVIDIYSGNTTDGTNAQIYDYNGSAAQLFTFWPETDIPSNLGDCFVAYIYNTQANKALTYDDDKNVTIRTKTLEKSQLWKFTRYPDGSYQIKSLVDGSCLDCESASDNVHLIYEKNNSAQKWKVYGSNGAYKIKPNNINKYMDIYSGSTADGTNVQVYDTNDTYSQKYTITTMALTKKPVLHTPIIEETSVTLAWDAVSYANGYTVRVYKDSTIVQEIDVTDATMCNLNLSSGNYSAEVAAYNTYAGISNNSGKANFMVESTSTPQSQYFTITSYEGYSNITNTADTSQAATVIVAEYNNGRLADMNSTVLTFEAGETRMFMHNNHSKIFVWDSLKGMKPLCDTVSKGI
ncbi:MAG: RICIN domain-containing protein [Oscillospiraceae bacterium]|nr:RICIN domain-containing protein [Oscillospiraceae bacterium]